MDPKQKKQPMGLHLVVEMNENSKQAMKQPKTLKQRVSPQGYAPMSQQQYHLDASDLLKKMNDKWINVRRWWSIS